MESVGSTARSTAAGNGAGGCLARGRGRPGGPERFRHLVLLAALLVASLALLSPPTAVGQDDARALVGGAPPDQPAERYLPRPPGVDVQVVLAGLEAPTALVFPPDGRLLIAERSGRIRVRMARSRLVEERPYALLPRSGGGAVLKDLALDPAFPSRPWVWVLYELRSASGRRQHRVSRLRDRGFAGDRETVVLDGLPAGTDPDAGRLIFGPAGHLYVGLGEPADPSMAQDPESAAGTILRVTADGAVPGDNPFDGAPAWSVGHMGVRGLAWASGSRLLVVESGAGGIAGRSGQGTTVRVGSLDEINAVAAGDNAGWPDAVGWTDQEGLVAPVAVWTEPSISPAGAARLDGDLYVATLGAEALVRVRLRDGAGNGPAPAAIERWFVSGPGAGGVYGRLREVARGPDGALWVLTSNRDGRGRVRRGDDKLLRIRLPGR